MTDIEESIDNHEPEMEASEDHAGSAALNADAGDENSEETGGQSPAEGGQAQESSYEPNFQYRVYDDVKEFPDWAKPLVSSQETEQHVRDLLTKAEGLEGMKDRYGRTKSDLQDVQGNLQKYDNFVRQAQHYSNQDLGTFMDMWNVPKDRVLNYARQLLEFDENPQAKAAYDERRQNIQQVYDTNQELEQLRSRDAQRDQELHNTNMRMALNQPHISEFVERFDGIKGRGSFLSHVGRYGSAIYSQNQQYVSPFDSVEAVFNEFKDLLPAGQQAAPGQQQERPKTIPNMGVGRAQSPAQSRPKTVDEMRKRFKQQGYV